MGLMNHLLNAATTAHARRYHGKSRVSNDFVNDARLDGLTLSRSAGSVYYFNGSGVLTATGDNVAAFTSNGLFIEGQATNLIAAASYRDISTWTATGASMKATTPTLIDGTTGTSAKNETLEDTGTTEHRYALAWTAATAAKQSAMVAVKRGTGTRHAQLRIGNATDGVYGSVTYNLDTLATIGAVTAEYSTAYVKGDYTIIELVDTNTTTGAQTIYVNIHDGSSNSYTGDGASTLVVDWAQVVTSGEPESHIQGAATRYQSFISRPWIGANNNFWVYVDFNAKAAYNMLNSSSLLRIMSIYNSGSNVFNCYFSGATGQVRMDHSRAGVQTLAALTSAMTYVAGTRLRVLMMLDQVNGARIRINYAGTQYTSSIAAALGYTVFGSGTTFYILNYDNTLDRTPNAELREYKVGTGILTEAQITGIIGA